MSTFKETLEQSLAAVAAAAEDQLKEAVSAAEQKARQTIVEVRTQYAKEVETAQTERALIERRLQAATKEFEEQKQIWSAKLAEAELASAKLQTDLEQSEAERAALENSVQRTTERLSETEERLSRNIAEKRDLDDRLQHIEGKRA